MERFGDAHAKVIGLAEARLLASRSRARWNREVVWFLIDELNGLYDGLQLRLRREERAARKAAAKSRIERILTAAGWISAEFSEAAWAFARTEAERPEDLFGPAVLLLGLAGGDPRVRSWAETLPDGTRVTLRLLGLVADQPE
jgi:hypothetical protein